MYSVCIIYFLVKVLNESELEATSSIHCTASSIKLGMEFYKIKTKINPLEMLLDQLNVHVIIIIIIIINNNNNNK